MPQTDKQPDKKYLFEEMPVTKAIKAMAVPTIVSQLINLIYNMVDAFFIGRTGNSYMMASVTISYTLFIMTLTVSNLFGNGGGSQMARLTGIGENRRAKIVSSYSFYNSILFAVGYSVLVFIFMDKLLYLFGASENTIDFARQYVLVAVVIGGIPAIVSTTLAHLLRNNGNAKQASIGLSGGGILNMILDPLFMFVLFPKGSEVLGAAVATMLSNTIALIYLLTVAVKASKNTNIGMSLSLVKEIEKSDRRLIYSVGVPSGLLTAFFDIANIFLNATVATYGDFALAAIGIILKVERIPNAICIGICQGTLPIVAYNFSSGNRVRMNSIITTSRKYGLAICGVSIAVLYFLARPLSSLFINKNGSDPEGALKTIAYSVTFLRLRSFACPVKFMNYQSSFSMQAMGDGRDTFIHSFIREFVFYIPLMYILNKVVGLNGLVFAVVLGESLGGMLAFALLSRLIKRTNTKEA